MYVCKRVLFSLTVILIKKFRGYFWENESDWYLFENWRISWLVEIVGGLSDLAMLSDPNGLESIVCSLGKLGG